MTKIVDYFKQYIGVISIVLAMCILLTYTLSYFMINTGNKRAAEMYVGELQYSMTIEGNSTNTLSVPSGETIVDIDVTNQNGVDTYFKLLYLKNDNVTISYYDKTKNTSETYTKYLSSGDIIDKNITGTLKLKIINNSSSAQTLTFSVSGGYSTNKLSDVDVPSIYSEITTMETTSSNTYFCDTLTSDPLSQGTEYINGQYTYRYKQELVRDEDENENTIYVWRNMDVDGWGVGVTDSTSTDPITTTPCTYINDKPIVSAQYMFVASNAATIDLSNFNTSNIINMDSMFMNSKATSITGLDKFDTSNVTNMYSMFWGSNVLTLDLSSFDTSKVTNMSHMFLAAKTTSLDLSSFDTSNVTDMSDMFAQSDLATIKGLNTFNTNKVIKMYGMFRLSKATSLDLSSFDTSNVTDMGGMFNASKAITISGLENFDTSNVTDMGSMFSGSQATTLDVSNFNTSKVTNMIGMFNSSKAITISGLENFDTSNVTDMRSMFDSSKVTTLDVSNFNTGKVTDMGSMFYGIQVASLDLSNFDTSNVTYMSSMFSSCKNLTTIYASNKFITNNVTNSTNMFNGSTKLVGGAGTK